MAPAQLAAAGQPKARAAIIGEPTSLVPVRMHKGIMMEAVRVTGRAGHSSNPDLGNSALDGMHAVMGDLMAYRQQLGERYTTTFSTWPSPPSTWAASTAATAPIASAARPNCTLTCA